MLQDSVRQHEELHRIGIQDRARNAHRIAGAGKIVAERGRLRPPPADVLLGMRLGVVAVLRPSVRRDVRVERRLPCRRELWEFEAEAAVATVAAAASAAETGDVRRPDARDVLGSKGIANRKPSDSLVPTRRRRRRLSETRRCATSRRGGDNDAQRNAAQSHATSVRVSGVGIGRLRIAHGVGQEIRALLVCDLEHEPYGAAGPRRRDRHVDFLARRQRFDRPNLRPAEPQQRRRVRQHLGRPC